MNHKCKGDNAVGDSKQQKKIWRYQLRWRSPQRIGQTLRAWINFLFTGDESLLLVKGDIKKQSISFDDISTEGICFSLKSAKEENTTIQKDANNDLIKHADAVSDSLSLIFRDRDAAIRNATKSRFDKHQESYDTKALDDLLGIAVQQSIGIGLSYDFDHFDSPSDGEEVSIHQLRARMAKSAVRRKRELDGSLGKELDLLHRLKENTVTVANKDIAEKETKSIENEIRERHANDLDKMRSALLTLIPTHADNPKGTDKYDNPIMVAEYVDLKAPVKFNRPFEAYKGRAPDPPSVADDYDRRNFRNEGADAYRQDEMAARRMPANRHQQYGVGTSDSEPVTPHITDGNNDVADASTSS